ncbi:MAG: hypothetical protein Q4A31_05310 [Corynebacterium sp.]|uniref:hypothetical protein n=1 Tax=Corynebacterium sp. TaxID=1720 RepID=UPI0026DC224A|nr:hypothetical protein [Corynebacterium sp.]MDO4761316.1 hypothetical protein [Corynebacterium sp.]
MHTALSRTFSRTLIALIAALALITLIVPRIAFAQENTYPLWVGGIQVSDANKNDVLGDGTVRYDSDTSTMHLNNANILNDQNPSEPGDHTRSAVHTTVKKLTVNATGSNTITVIPTHPSSEVFTQKSGEDSTLTFTGNGTIAMEMKSPAKPYPYFNIPSYGVYEAEGHTIFAGPDMSFHVAGGTTSSALESRSGITVKQGAIHAHADGGYRGIITVHTNGDLRIDGGSLTALTGDISHKSTRVGGDYKSISVKPDKLFVLKGVLIAKTQDILFSEHVQIRERQRVFVNTSHLEEGAQPWDRVTILGGTHSPYRYVRIEGVNNITPPSTTTPTAQPSSTSPAPAPTSTEPLPPTSAAPTTETSSTAPPTTSVTPPATTEPAPSTTATPSTTPAPPTPLEQIRALLRALLAALKNLPLISLLLNVFSS